MTRLTLVITILGSCITVGDNVVAAILVVLVLAFV